MSANATGRRGPARGGPAHGPEVRLAARRQPAPAVLRAAVRRGRGRHRDRARVQPHRARTRTCWAPRQFPAPASMVWAGVSKLLVHGRGRAAPHRACGRPHAARSLGVVAGAAGALGPAKAVKAFVPSASGLGLAIVIPGSSSIGALRRRGARGAAAPREAEARGGRGAARQLGLHRGREPDGHRHQAARGGRHRRLRAEVAPPARQGSGRSGPVAPRGDRSRTQTVASAPESRQILEHIYALPHALDPLRPPAAGRRGCRRVPCAGGAAARRDPLRGQRAARGRPPAAAARGRQAPARARARPLYEECLRLGEEAFRKGEVAAWWWPAAPARASAAAVKGLVPVLGERTFLDLKLADAQRAGRALRAPGAGGADDLLPHARGHRRDLARRARPSGTCSSSGSACCRGSRPSWASSARRTGELSLRALGPRRLLPRAARQRRARSCASAACATLYFSNVDNLAATLDPVVIGLHLKRGAAMTVEVTPRAQPRAARWTRAPRRCASTASSSWWRRWTPTQHAAHLHQQHHLRRWTPLLGARGAHSLPRGAQEGGGTEPCSSSSR